MKAKQSHKDPRPIMEIDDIPGARPARRQFQKKIYREKHQQEIKKFKRPQLDLLGDVYLQSRSQRFHDGLPMFISNLSNSRGSGFEARSFSSMNPEYYHNGNKPQWSKVDLSQSMPIQFIQQKSNNKPKEKLPQPTQKKQVKQVNKTNLFNESQNYKSKQLLSKSAILSSSGLKSFTSQSIVKNNPYFPQIYQDEKQMFYHSNKFTGNRYWNGQATNSISITKDNNAYYPKWER